MTAPDKIIAKQHGGHAVQGQNYQTGQWFEVGYPEPFSGVEYTRSDLIAARPALHPASPLGAVMEVPEVRALVEALTPFDAVSIEMFSRNYNASDIVLTVGPVSGTCLTFRDFLNVRAALAPFARKGE